MSIDCDTLRYKFMLVYANLSLLVYSIGIPLILFFRLFKWRRELNPPGFEDEARAIKTRMKNKAMLAEPIVKFATRYRPHRWWYEVYTLGRRFALTSLVLAFPTLESSSVYVIMIGFSTLLVDREWVAHIDGYASALSHALNVQVALAPIYMLMLDARIIVGAYSVIISVGLFVLNLVMVGAMMLIAARELKALKAKDEQLKTLNAQLVSDKQEDANKFAEAWSKLIDAGAEGDEARLLETLDALAQASALSSGKQPTPKQADTIGTVDELLEEAEEIAPRFHDFLSDLVEQGGGTYKEGPNKTRPRAIEKIEKDYNGDPRKLVDVVRASAIFTTFVQLTLFVGVLLEKGCRLIVVRAKDRFNKPLDSGYRDMLLNVKLTGSDHVGELQLHLQTIIDIKESAHRTYALMRAVGWEDDSVEEEDEEVVDTMNSELRETWSSTWLKPGRDAREPGMTLEMTSTNDGPLRIDQENPIIAATRKAAQGEGPGTRGNQSKAAEARTHLDLGDHINIHVVESEGGAAEDRSDDEVEGSEGRVSIGGVDWSVKKPSRRSTITVFEQADVGELRDGTSQGETVSPARLPGGGPRTLAKKRSSMSAVGL